MSDYRGQLEAVCRGAVVRSATTYSWFGEPSPRLLPTVQRELSATTARGYLLDQLRARLYRDFYCPGAPAPAREHAARAPAIGSPTFVARLSEANAGVGRWEDGWEVRAVGDAHVVVRRGETELWARAGQYEAFSEATITPGESVRLRLSKEYVGLAPGYYIADGDRDPPSDGSPALVRLYWNLTADGAVRFVRAATAMLNRDGFAFRLKVLNDPAAYGRSDAGVLYLRTSDYAALAGPLRRIYAEVADDINPATPALTRPLAAGLGLAEDPGPGDSFGLHRCRLVADGLIRAYERGWRSPTGRLSAVEERFGEAGISLAAPYLNPGSADTYGGLNVAPSARARRFLAAFSGPPPSADTVLAVAADIGARLTREAIWHRGQCNWVGVLPNGDNTGAGEPSARYGALGPDLYAGTSGVALFLAELHAATGDPVYRRTALGAIRQALGHADAVPPSMRLGLYAGWSGIALAAVRVGTILGADELLGRASALLRRARRAIEGEHDHDVISGAAGAIVALLALGGPLGDASLLTFARRLGDDLIHAAKESALGYAWAIPGHARDQPWTGWAHGTAGIGAALLELGAATGAARYIHAAEMAFRYERTWFDERAGNWPDFRGVRAGRGRNTFPPRYTATWCHGAPGIALARLRAYILLGDATYLAEARIALRTTRAAIETECHSGTRNYSLCHGLAGNAEVLLQGCQVLRHAGDPNGEDDAAVALAVAAAGIEAHAAGGRSWPCGNAGGETPGLMLGLAGIRHFYLRLRDAAVPSVLFPQHVLIQHTPSPAPRRGRSSLDAWRTPCHAAIGHRQRG